MLDFHVISLSQMISPPDNSGSGFLLAISQEIHKMMLEEERNVAALEKIKPRQLVLPAHVPLASNPFIATARKSKMGDWEKASEQQRGAGTTTALTGSRLVLSQNCHPRSFLSLHRRAQRNSEIREHSQEVITNVYVSSSQFVGLTSCTDTCTDTSGNKKIHSLP